MEYESMNGHIPDGCNILKALYRGQLPNSSPHPTLFGRQLSKANLDEAVQELIAQGNVELTTVKTKGRPKTLVTIADQQTASATIPENSHVNTDY